jgi:hypothetical protein
MLMSFQTISSINYASTKRKFVVLTFFIDGFSGGGGGGGGGECAPPESLPTQPRETCITPQKNFKRSLERSRLRLFDLHSPTQVVSRLHATVLGKRCVV